MRLLNYAWGREDGWSGEVWTVWDTKSKKETKWKESGEGFLGKEAGFERKELKFKKKENNEEYLLVTWVVLQCTLGKLKVEVERWPDG